MDSAGRRLGTARQRRDRPSAAHLGDALPAVALPAGGCPAATLRFATGAFYETRAVKRRDGVRVALWAGDAGYEDWDADREGTRHRLVMPESGFTFENDCVDY